MNYLISYPYLKGNASKLVDDYRKMMNELYLDSGAYSVNQNKCRVKVGEYAQYLKLFGSKFDHYFNLDDDFEDTEHNQKNLRFIEKIVENSGKKLIPVLHSFDKSYEEFKIYADKGYEYVAIGSNVKAMKEICEKSRTEYPNVKIHLFGTLDEELLNDCQPDSADSAGFSHSAKYGNILFWHQEKKHVVNLGKRDDPDEKLIQFSNFEFKTELEKFLKDTFQFEKKDIVNNESNAQIVNLYYNYLLQERLNSKTKTKVVA